MAVVNKPAAMLACLPASAQQRLRDIGAGARGPFGGLREHQRLFDAHLDFFEALAADGVSHAEIGLLLAGVGVERPDGRPLSRGTVSGALSRARERAAARSAAAAASRGTPDLQQPAAASGSALQQPAAAVEDPQPPAASRREQPSIAASGRRPPAAGARANAPTDRQAAARNRRAASLIVKLRST